MWFQRHYYGVPQDTDLGACRFLIFIEDLYDLSTGDVASCIDDTLLLYRRNTQNGLRSQIENDFRYCIFFYNNGLLTLNKEKIRFMMYGSFAHKLPKFTQHKIEIYKTHQNIDIQSSTREYSCHKIPSENKITNKRIFFRQREQE